MFIRKKGFTLIEVLIVIGIIAILATIVLVAINPSRQFAQANDAQRSSNVAAILSAIGQYAVDNRGELPDGITGTEAEVSEALCNDLVPTYLPALPTDPKSTSAGAAITDCTDVDTGDVGYTVELDGADRVTVTAPDTEVKTPDISVTR